MIVVSHRLVSQAGEILSIFPLIGGPIMVDISKKDELERYLLDRKIINKKDGYSMNYCSGGVSGTVAFVYAGDKPMIIKQALAQLKVKETWLCDPNRMNIEQLSNQVYYRYVPESVPQVYFYDAENYIYGREAAPESCSMWKSDLLTGLLDFSVAEQSITALAIVHTQCATDKQVAIDFASKDVFYNLRISPYIEFTVLKHPDLENYAKPIVKELMESTITLVHGDYSPKNILVNERKISILDFEVAHYGHPSFDLAFFSNHFLLKSIKNKQFAPAYLNMLTYMLDIYFKTITFMDTRELEQSFVKLLALLLLARVDGKSPVEYLTEASDKQLVRNLAYHIMDEKLTTYADVIRFANTLTTKIKE